jgi:hypothetical protein
MIDDRIDGFLLHNTTVQILVTKGYFIMAIYLCIENYNLRSETTAPGCHVYNGRSTIKMSGLTFRSWFSVIYRVSFVPVPLLFPTGPLG